MPVAHLVGVGAGWVGMPLFGYGPFGWRGQVPDKLVKIIDLAPLLCDHVFGSRHTGVVTLLCYAVPPTMV